jgi:hypothetical protein
VSGFIRVINFNLSIYKLPVLCVCVECNNVNDKLHIETVYSVTVLYTNNRCFDGKWRALRDDYRQYKGFLLLSNLLYWAHRLTLCLFRKTNL